MRGDVVRECRSFSYCATGLKCTYAAPMHEVARLFRALSDAYTGIDLLLRFELQRGSIWCMFLWVHWSMLSMLILLLCRALPFP